MNLPGKYLNQKSDNSFGQALILVLLGMAVVLTLVLSIVSRSITDVSITSKDENFMRAFYAAEAGIEKALLIGENAEGTLPNMSSYSAQATNLAEGSTEYNIPEKLMSGESATVWFVSHDASGNFACGEDLPCFTGDVIEVCWGDEGTNASLSETPAVEFTIYYDSTQQGIFNGNFSGVKIFRKTFDPNSTRTEGNKFGAAYTNCNLQDYAFTGTTIIGNADIPCRNTPGCLLMGRIKMLYNTTSPHSVGARVGCNAVCTNSTLPSQGTFIPSTGSFSGANAKIEKSVTLKEPLSIFESAVFSMGSGSDLVKP